ncbi:unnamed protein product [Rotaria magnacalcarata]|uniref:Retrotransposon gag domain-containing protein n=1 Tax=Rotaria magnacalcarata TaxID=392030 RepID=A0A816UB53_9BILA|nr:unnamed protein product [Rotaria magnacalcarata]CAF4464125.1 unnamed protein product [Rotaria magnacalcarata]
MAEELFNAILLNSLEKLPLFGGQQNENVEKWLEEITYGFNFAGFDDDQKVRVIHIYLTGEARKWIIKNMSVLDSWSTFVEAIITAHSSSVQKQMIPFQMNMVKEVRKVEEKKAELIEIDEEIAELVNKEEKDTEKFEDFIHTSFENEKILNEMVSNCNILPITSMIQNIENVGNVIPLLWFFNESNYLQKYIDMDIIKHIVCILHDCSLIYTFICLKLIQLLWFNLFLCNINWWDWFRTLAVP